MWQAYVTAVSSEAWAKLRDWASMAGRGRLLLSGSVAHPSLKTAVYKYRVGPRLRELAFWLHPAMRGRYSRNFD